MNYYSKILSVICTGLLVLGTTMSVLPVKAEESPLQSGSSMQVRGVVLDSENQPVIGASIVEVGSKSNGTLLWP